MAQTKRRRNDRFGRGLSSPKGPKRRLPTIAAEADPQAKATAFVVARIERHDQSPNDTTNAGEERQATAAGHAEPKKDAFREEQAKPHPTKAMKYKDPTLAVFGRFAFDDGEYSDMLRDINEALSKGECSDKDVDCFRLYYVQGLTMAEIGDLLKIDKSTVSRHVKKATWTCRVLLGLVEVKVAPRRWGHLYLTK